MAKATAKLSTDGFVGRRRGAIAVLPGIGVIVGHLDRLILTVVGPAILEADSPSLNPETGRSHEDHRCAGVRPFARTQPGHLEIEIGGVLDGIGDATGNGRKA